MKNLAMTGCQLSVVGFALGIALAFLGGCAQRAHVMAGRDFRVERSRDGVLVVPGSRDPGTLPAAREATRLLTAELASRWFNVLDLEIVLRDSPDLGPDVVRISQQALAGLRVDPVVADVLFRRYGVGQLLVTDVFRYEQYWGRQTKITRVGVEARLVQMAESRILWQGRYDPELSGAAGNGFDSATRRVVRELVRVMTNGLPEFRDLPLAEWPILEYLAPN